MLTSWLNPDISGIPEFGGKFGWGAEGLDLVRSDGLWVFKAELIDSETLDFRIECPRWDA
jgi:hypothetical protein